MRHATKIFAVILVLASAFFLLPQTVSFASDSDDGCFALPNSIDHPTGVKEPSAQELALIEATAQEAVKILPNESGLDRINESREANGLSQLSMQYAESSDGIILDNDSGYNLSEYTAYSLPVMVDNSQLKYFPQIGDQGSLGSCAAFATTYYMMTYTTARARDWDVKTDGYSKIFSPKWAYNLDNNGNDDGSYPGDIAIIMQCNGAPTWQEFPYDSDFRQWPTTASTWRSAMKYAISGYGFIRDLNTPAGLNNLKNALNNGMVVEMMTDDFYGWVGNTVKDNPDSTADDSVVGKWAAYYMNEWGGRHAIVIVGYNDAIWCDRNNDNVRQDDELGAFKVANSWGASWGDNGYTWFSYAAVNDTKETTGHAAITKDNMVMYLQTDARDYVPLVTADVTLTTADRGDLDFFCGANWPQTNLPDTVDRMDWPSYFKLSNPAYPFWGNGGKYSLAGTTTSTTGTVVVNLSDLLTGGNFTYYSPDPHDWSGSGGDLAYCLGISDRTLNTGSTINSVVFHVDKTGQTISAEEPSTFVDDDIAWYHAVGPLNPGSSAPAADAGVYNLPQMTPGTPVSATLTSQSPTKEWRFTPTETGTYLFYTDSQKVSFEVQNDARNTLYKSGTLSCALTPIRGKFYAGTTYVFKTSGTFYFGSESSISCRCMLKMINPASDADLFDFFQVDEDCTRLNIAPAFDANTYQYSVVLPEGKEYFRIYPITESERARIYIDGQPAREKEIILNWLDHVQVKVAVVSQDASNRKEYTINVTRPYSSNADISYLNLSGIPGYGILPDGTYDCGMPVGLDSTTLTPIPASKYASVTIDGVQQASKTYTPRIGETLSSTVVVTSQDGTNSKTYRLKIRKPGSDLYITNLNLSAGAATPALHPAMTEYFWFVPSSVSQFTLSPVCSVADAQMYIDGVKTNTKTYQAFNQPTMQIKIKLVCDEGRTVKEYTLTVGRYAGSLPIPGAPNAGSSSGITASVGVLSPGFNAQTYQYSLKLDEYTSSVNITFQKVLSSDKVTMDASSRLSRSYTLKPGASKTVTVRVKSGKITTVYKINIQRAKSTNSDLSSLSVKSGNMTPAFSQDSGDYTAVLSASQGSVSIKAAKADKYALTIINGSKTAQKSIKIANGEKKTVTISCIAQAGNSKAWSVTLVKPPRIKTLKAAPRISGKPAVQPGIKPLTITYALVGAGGYAKLDVLTQTGWATLTEGQVSSKTQKYVWDGTIAGAQLPPGLYTLRLSASSNGLDAVPKTTVICVK